MATIEKWRICSGKESESFISWKQEFNTVIKYTNFPIGTQKNTLIGVNQQASYFCACDLSFKCLSDSLCTSSYMSLWSGLEWLFLKEYLNIIEINTWTEQFHTTSQCYLESEPNIW